MLAATCFMTLDIETFGNCPDSELIFHKFLYVFILPLQPEQQPFRFIKKNLQTISQPFYVCLLVLTAGTSLTYLIASACDN